MCRYLCLYFGKRDKCNRVFSQEMKCASADLFTPLSRPCRLLHPLGTLPHCAYGGGREPASPSMHSFMRFRLDVSCVCFYSGTWDYTMSLVSYLNGWTNIGREPRS